MRWRCWAGSRLPQQPDSRTRLNNLIQQPLFNNAPQGFVPRPAAPARLLCLSLSTCFVRLLLSIRSVSFVDPCWCGDLLGSRGDGDSLPEVAREAASSVHVFHSEHHAQGQANVELAFGDIGKNRRSSSRPGRVCVVELDLTRPTTLLKGPFYGRLRLFAFFTYPYRLALLTYCCPSAWFVRRSALVRRSLRQQGRRGQLSRSSA